MKPLLINDNRLNKTNSVHKHLLMFLYKNKHPPKDMCNAVCVYMYIIAIM